jgi:hypothetical protein
VIAGAHVEQVVTRLILDFAVGRRSYKDLRRRLMARSPWLAARMAWERLAGKTVAESRQAL